MKIAYLYSNVWGQPTLQDWLPVTNMPENMVQGVRLGRKHAMGQVPVSLWLTPMPPSDTPVLHRSLFVNWRRPYILEAFPSVKAMTVLDRSQLKAKTVEKLYLSRHGAPDVSVSEDAVLLVFDLHTGRGEREVSTDLHGRMYFNSPEFYQKYVVYHAATYSVGVMVLQPGFVGMFQLEKMTEKFKLIYTKKDGVFIAPDIELVATEPVTQVFFDAFPEPVLAAKTTFLRGKQ